MTPIEDCGKNIKMKRIKKYPPEYWILNELYYSEPPPMEKIMKRKPMRKSFSKKTFKKGMNIQKKNIMPAPQRGGYRL